MGGGDLRQESCFIPPMLIASQALSSCLLHPTPKVTLGSKDGPWCKEASPCQASSVHQDVCRLPGRRNPSPKYSPTGYNHNRSSSKLFTCTFTWLCKDTKQSCSFCKLCCIRKLGRSREVLKDTDKADLNLITFYYNIWDRGKEKKENKRSLPIPDIMHFHSNFHFLGREGRGNYYSHLDISLKTGKG